MLTSKPSDFNLSATSSNTGAISSSISTSSVKAVVLVIGARGIKSNISVLTRTSALKVELARVSGMYIFFTAAKMGWSPSAVLWPNKTLMDFPDSSAPTVSRMFRSSTVKTHLVFSSGLFWYLIMGKNAFPASVDKSTSHWVSLL